MRLKVLSLLLVAVLLASTSGVTIAKQNGIYNQASGCSCHYGGSATVSMTGQPSTYNAGQTYTLQISVSNGVSGSAGGFSLEADKGVLSTGGVGTMAVKVNAAQNSATHTTSSYRSWSVDWTAPTTGSGVVTFDLGGLTANGNGATGGDAWGTATYQVPETPSGNNPPSASITQMSPSNPVTTDTLTLTYSYNDQDGDAESGTTIRWYRDGTHVSSRDDMTTIPPSLTTKGETWNATVTPSDGTDVGSPVHSTSLLIVNSIPVVTSGQITPGDATEDDDLMVTWTSSDADNDQRTPSGIEWYVDDSKVNAFDGDETIPSVAVRSGDVWYAKIKVNDGEDDSLWFTTGDITIGSNNQPPVMQSLDIGGPYTTVDDIIASASGSDPDGDSLTYEWEWVGFFHSTNTLPSEQTNKGDTITVKCRVSDGTLYSDWLQDSVTIQNTAPTLISLEIDQDTVFFENEVTYSHSASDVDGDSLTLDEQWNREGDVYTLTLSVSDTSGAVSNVMSDSVLIVNSLPVATYDGALEFTALADLAPVFETSDANEDEVTLSYAWTRNGFSTEITDRTVPAARLAPGDVWTIMVTPNDGEDDGQVLTVPFTITNTAPTAVITAPESMMAGAAVTFSAADSTDPDGAVVSAMWFVDGNHVATGLSHQMVMTGTLVLEVTVFDDQGSTDSTIGTYTATNPPEASNVKAVAEGSKVRLTWSGNAEEWAVFAGDTLLGTTDENEYLHSPEIEGLQVYHIAPIVDGEILDWKNSDSFVEIQMDASSVEDAPGPSATLGMIFGIIMLLIGATGVALSFVPRRD